MTVEKETHDGQAVSEHAKSCHGGCEGTGMLPCLPCDRLETAKDSCEEPVPCPDCAEPA